MNSMRPASLLILLASAVAARATVLDVPASVTRSGAWVANSDAAARSFAAHAAYLTGKSRAKRPHALMAFPTTVFPNVNGRRPSIEASGRADPVVSLTFDTASGRTFSSGYQTLLQNVWTTMKPRIDALFGVPSVGGNVLVSNLGNDLFDREVVTGGYYYYGGALDQQIRFQEYSVPEAAAVHFIHCILLAYIGPKVLPTDAYQEGLVRAAVIKLCRTPGALPATLDMDVVESVLGQSYDIGPGYHWANQKTLAAPTFIPANLRSVALPTSGSVGGPYLMRYLMAGSCFQKLLVEYPTFPNAFLANWYTNINRDPATVVQQAMDTIKGPSSTVEGKSFAAWSLRQGILGQKIIAGTKLHLAVTPITSGLSGADFGVFNIEAELFKTETNGNESLLADTAYPIYWSPDFNRVFASVQDDRTDFFQAYASVTPNFTNALSGAPYRLTVDFPVADEIARAYLPAGAIATATNPIPNNLYGTITGVTAQSGVSYRVSVTWPGGSFITPVQNYAFGGSVGTASFLDAQSVTVQLLRDVSGGGTSVVTTETINKGAGAMSFDLHVGADQNRSLTIPGGLAMTGFSGQPYEAYVPNLLGTNPASTLLARWDPLLGGYRKFPSTGAVTKGQGFFSRLNALKVVTYDYQLEQDVPHSVRLKPGWNIVSSPMPGSVSKDDARVISTTSFPQAFGDAAAAGVVGPEIFRLQTGAADPGSGVPETGTMVPATSFEPGVATYVRVLSSDGAVIVFPSQVSGRSITTRLPSRLIDMSVSGEGSRSMAQIGTDANPRNLWSGLPPLMDGALQLSLNGGLKLYREVKRNHADQTFLFQADNLVKGKLYTVRLLGKDGFSKYLFWDVSTGRRLVAGQARTYVFKATGPTRQFRVMVLR